MPAPRWMVYGAYGYTGKLIVEAAMARGEAPVVAGRRAAGVHEMAQRLGLEGRVVGLDDQVALQDALGEVDAVVHAAGPFSATWRPMVEACLATGTHYLDITGELGVFEAIFRRHGQAQEAGVVLLPGVGFDVVPTDCLAAMVAAELPDATDLVLAFHGDGGVSAGTAKTALEGMGMGSAERVDGAIVPLAAATITRTIPFADKDRLGVAIGWGDVSTAYRSTGIPNIRTYMAMSPRALASVRRAARLGWLMRSGPIRRAAQALVGRWVDGPDAEARERGSSGVWAEVRNAVGAQVTATLRAPEGYTFTAQAALAAVLRILGGTVEAGAHTPVTAFGADFVKGLEGVTVTEPVHGQR